MVELKVGKYINCHDQEGLKRKLKELGAAGYGAVRTSYSRFWIIITSVPKKEGEHDEKDNT